MAGVSLKASHSAFDFHRRALLQVGIVSSLGSVAGKRPAAWASGDEFKGRAKRCIVLFLLGGPPQHSTWDPKPQAPAEIRGELASIPTMTPGMDVCELLPETARISDRLAILRAVDTGDNAHSSSGYAMLTGQPHLPLQVENANPGPPNDFPSLGAVVQQLRPASGLLPAAIRLPHHIFNTDQSVWPGQDSGFLGIQADPWLFRCQPGDENFEVPHFRMPAEVPMARLQTRWELLQHLEKGSVARISNLQLSAYELQREQALSILGTAKARTACDLNLEPAKVRDRYGRSQFGQSVLLGRRLLEAGVNFVHVNWFRGPDEPADSPCWDSHGNETQRLKTALLPPFDLAFSALIHDLTERGMLEDTLVAVLAEFGRTPRFNSRAGRDHWGHVFSVVFAGGGIRGGLVHGASDAQGAYPMEGRVGPGDIAATIYHCLGIPPETEIHNTLGRPIPITRGSPIQSILT